jgi:L-amino acid N-acyltransferase YncA
LRQINNWRRPSKKDNERRLRARGESMDCFTIRDAVESDVIALARLHVACWSQTYGGEATPELCKMREAQWREIFRNINESWFCFVVEKNNGELIGFAKGQKYRHDSLPQYDGELNKIYLLRDYQRVGIGRKLFLQVVKRFLTQGINTMVLFGVPQNPSCKFHEAMKGQRLLDNDGIFQGGYGWTDLQQFVLSGDI